MHMRNHVWILHHDIHKRVREPVAKFDRVARGLVRAFVFECAECHPVAIAHVPGQRILLEAVIVLAAWHNLEVGAHLHTHTCRQ